MAYKERNVSFKVSNSSVITNVTGDSTMYKVIYNTEDQDTSNSFNIATGEFTAPSSGFYLFTVGIQVTGLSASTFDMLYYINVNSVNYRIRRLNMGLLRLNNDFYGTSGQIMVYMEASHVAYVNMFINQGSKTVDIAGNVQNNWFSGVKIS